LGGFSFLCGYNISKTPLNHFLTIAYLPEPDLLKLTSFLWEDCWHQLYCNAVKIVFVMFFKYYCNEKKPLYITKNIK